MKKIAILGFGVVGSGVAEVLTQNKKHIDFLINTHQNVLKPVYPHQNIFHHYLMLH